MTNQIHSDQNSSNKNQTIPINANPINANTLNQDIIDNDFVLVVSTVNGSGSQSANTILLKTLFRMGVSVSGKNVFPSNIAGLPTWFWIRASAQGFSARRKSPQIVVAMNPQVLKQDYQSLLPNGVFIYNSEFSLPESEYNRSDIYAIPIPVKSLVDQSTDQGKIKKLLANMIYVGVLAELLALDGELLEGAIESQFEGKANVLKVNQKAMELGKAYAREHKNNWIFPYKSKSILNGNSNKMIWDGNTAAALGLVYGGAHFVSWYPITPSTSIVENFSKFVKQVRPQIEGKNPYAIIQAEDELSAISMTIGAAWQGARAFTATSGPGLSLMQEAIGFAYYSEIPLVLWNVQRVGPSTGMPTRTAQGDLLSAVFASHGDTKHPVLLPGDPAEIFEFAQLSLDLAERLQTPIMVLTDLDLGMNLWTSNEIKWPEKPMDRGKTLSAEELDLRPQYGRYQDVDGDGIAYRVLPGTRHPKAGYLARGSGHNEKALYTENAEEYKTVVDRLSLKWETTKKWVPKSIIEQNNKSKIAIIGYGSSDPAIQEARSLLMSHGVTTNYLRIRAIPFCQGVLDFINQNDEIYIVDLNRDAQMFQLLRIEFSNQCHKLKTITHYDGTPITSDVVFDPLIFKFKGGV